MTRKTKVQLEEENKKLREELTHLAILSRLTGYEGTLLSTEGRVDRLEQKAKELDERLLKLEGDIITKLLTGD
ncbi:MAG: hypothetical protein ABIH46_05710 [Chloroflexota bacterium]